MWDRGPPPPPSEKEVPMKETTKRALQFAAAPFLGFAFIVFLPAIGFGLLGYVLVLKTKEIINGILHQPSRFTV